MPIQIIDENRKPSIGERLTGALDRGMQHLSEHRDTNLFLSNYTSLSHSSIIIPRTIAGAPAPAKTTILFGVK